MAVDSAGGNSQAAAAAAARARAEAEARARAEAEARAKAEAEAKAKAEAAKKQAEEAQKAAAKAQEEAAKAKAASANAHQDVNKLHDDLKANPDKKAELEPKIGAAQDRATRLHNDAQSAQSHADQLTARANAKANQALTAEKGANQAAEANGKKDPFAAANKVKDAYDAKGQLSEADQKKLFGGKLAVSSEDAGKVDAQRLAQQKDPDKRAAMLQSYMKDGQDPKYQKAFLDAAKPEIQQMSKQIWDDKSGVSTDQRQKALNTLTSMSENLSPDAQKELANQFAETLPNRGLGSDSNNLGGMLQKSIEDGKGVTFGARLTSALQANGKTDAANDAAKYVNNGITSVKKEFDEQSKTMDQKNALLSKATSFKGVADPKEALKLANDTKKKIGYDDEKKKFEDASAKMASVLNGANLAARDPSLNVCSVKDDNGNEQKLGATARSAMQEIPNLAKSNAGSKAIAKAVEDGGEDKPNFLENVKEYGEQGTKFVNKVRDAVIQSVGARALSLAQDRNFDKGSRDLFRGVSKLGGLFGASDEQMARLSTTLSAFRSGLTPAKTQAISNELNKQIDDISGSPKGPMAQGLKGLSSVFGIASAYQGIDQFGKQDLNEKIQTVTTTLQAGKETAELVMGATTQYLGGLSSTLTTAAEAGSSALETLGKTLNPALQLVGAVTTGIQAYNEFKDGQIVAGVGDSITSAGSLIAGASEFAAVVPVIGDAVAGVGQVAGDVLSVAGQAIKVIGGLFSSPPDPYAGAKDGIKQGFLDSGFSDDTASQLSELHGKEQNTFASYLDQVAKAAGQKPSDLLNSMKSWDSTHVRNFLDAARLSFDTDGGNDNRYNNAKGVIGQSLADRLENGDKSYLQKTGKDGQPEYNHQVIQASANWLYSQGLIATPPVHPGANA